MKRRVTFFLIALASAIVIVAVGILPFLTPQWIAFEQGRSQAAAWTGFTSEDLRTATDAILADLVFGGDFDVEINGAPVLTEREQAHMADVRTIFRGLWILASISLLLLVFASWRPDRVRTWQAVRRGAQGLTVGVVIVGVVGLLAFDRLFEIFHKVFFPAGSYLFDPTTDRLVQLFPFQFWQETAIAAGVVIIGISLATAYVAGRRMRHHADAVDRPPDLLPVAERSA